MIRFRLLILILSVAAPLAAQEETLFPVFSVSAGSYAAGFDTDIRVDDTSTAAEGTSIQAAPSGAASGAESAVLSLSTRTV